MCFFEKGRTGEPLLERIGDPWYLSKPGIADYVWIRPLIMGMGDG